MAKTLKKRHFFGFVILGMFFMLLLVVASIFFFAYSQKVVLNFHVNETGETLDGVLYQRGVELGRVVNGDVELIWEDYYPGEIEFQIEKGGSYYSFFFDLDQVDIENGGSSFYVFQYQIDDLDLDASSYNFKEIDSLIISSINEERNSNAVDSLIVDSRLEDIVSDVISEILFEDIYDNDYIDNFIIDEMLDKKIFFYGFDSYYYGYQLNSTMNISKEFLDSIYYEDFWYDKFISPYVENVAVVTECNSSNYCLTFILVSQNSLYFALDEELRSDYLQAYDIYYLLESFGLEMDYPVNVTIILNSTKTIELSLVDSMEDYERILNRNGVKEIFQIRDNNIRKDVEIVPNNTIVVSADYGTTEYSLWIAESV